MVEAPWDSMLDPGLQTIYVEISGVRNNGDLAPAAAGEAVGGELHGTRLFADQGQYG